MNIRCANLVLALVLVGCAASEDVASVAPETREVEDLDLFRLDGERLYVYSRAGVLSVVDVTDATTPEVMAALAIDGRAGELFTRDGNVILVVEERTVSCQERPEWRGVYQDSEVALIPFVDGALEVTERICLPGQVIGSRMVGDILYVVTTDWEQTRVLAFDTAQSLTLVDTVTLVGSAHEIHVTPQALFVAQQDAIDDGQHYRWDMTRLTYVDISDAGGVMARRGSVLVEGEPQGRFHLDAADTTFRIVTFDNVVWASRLHVIDIANPDALELIGSSEPIGAGEQLYATRFVGDRAYVVTFRQTDPLWVVDLSDATDPHIVGELMVPGWSDFIFPRGDTLITVGRGDGGSGVALAAFDVANPEEPTLIDRLELGDWSTSSEANHDHRGVRIFEPGAVADSNGPVIALPTSWDNWNGEVGCESYLQLIEYDDSRFVARGGVDQAGAIRRTLDIDGELYSISDLGLLAIDARDLEQPSISTAVTFDGADGSHGCTYDYPMFFDEGHHGGMFPFLCSSRGAAPGLSVVLTLGLLALLRRRR